MACAISLEAALDGSYRDPPARDERVWRLANRIVPLIPPPAPPRTRHDTRVANLADLKQAFEDVSDEITPAKGTAL